jgi:beta-xylosidase
MKIQGLYWLANVAGIAHSASPSPDSTYTNPILPGWNSDPSCVSVNDTIFCTTSSFAAFPGVPVYASKDLVNWKLASNALNLPEQVPEMAVYPGNDAAGMWASTLRHRDDVFYLITAFVTWVPA